MVLRVARGLFRLWLVLSVLWIGGVVFVTMPNGAPGRIVSWCPSGPPLPPNTPCNLERSLPNLFHEIKLSLWLGVRPPDFYFASNDEGDKAANEMLANDRRVSQIGILLALVPPAFVLALGSALVWAFRVFR
jgi:hypothetical protein